MASNSPTAANLVTVSGTGEVRAEADGGNAISTNGSVSVAGGKVSATTGIPIYANGDSSAATVSGGVVFAYNLVVSNVVSLPNNSSGYTGPTNTGVVIAWNKAEAGANPTYNAGDATNLTYAPNPGATVAWALENANAGISYANSTNIGFIPVAGVTVNAGTNTAPAAPGGFTATAGDAQVVLNWTTPGNGGSAITGYEVSYGVTIGYTASWSAIPSSGASTTSHTVTGLNNGTGYTFEVRAVNIAGNGATSGTQTATPAKPVFTGTPTITVSDSHNPPQYGDTLTAAATGFSSTPVITDLGTLTYQWKRNGSTNIGTNSATYTIVQADIEQTITVTVTAANCTGEVPSTATGTITKAAQSAPASVTGVSSDNGQTYTYTVAAIAGAEYQMDGTGGTWQASNVFSNIAPSTTVTHTFYARIKETATHNASPDANTGAVNFPKLTPAAPALGYTVSGPAGGKTITITLVSGAEYNFDGDGWSGTNTKTYIGDVTAAIEIRLASTATHNQSPAASASVNLANQEQPAPAAFTLTYSYNAGSNNFTVTILAITDAEYSFDGTTFSSDRTTTAASGSTVTGYARLAAKTGYNASPATGASVTLPIPVVSIEVSGAGNADTITMNGGTLQLSAAVSPANADNQTVTCSITGGAGNANLSGGGLLTATNNGSVTVRATANDGSGVYGEKTITITGQVPAVIPIISISVNGGDTISTKGGTLQLSASVLPANATNRTVTWSVYSGSGATISATGLLTATANGSVTVRAIANDGSGVYGAKTVSITNQSDSNNNGGGGGGGGSSSSNTKTPPNTAVTTDPTKPNMPVIATITLTAKPDANGLLSLTMSDADIKAAIEKAQAEARRLGKTADGISIVFTDNAAGVKNLSVNIPAAALDRLNAAKVKDFSVNTALFNFSFDTAGITQLDAQTTGNVIISAKPAALLSDAAKRVIGNRPVFNVTIQYTQNGAVKYVTDLKTGSMTRGIAYTPTATERTGNLFIAYIKANLQPELLTNSSYVDGFMIWKGNSCSVYGVGYKNTAPAFTDTAAHWAADDIDFVSSRGLLTGTTATAFSPNAAMTRGMFVTMLGRLSGQDMSKYTARRFTDVKAGTYYLPYVEWAVSHNIVGGTGNSQFSPDRAVTREEMAVMICNYAKATGYKLSISREALTFADSASISSWARDAVKAAQQAGIISGKGNNRFDPKGAATRAETSAMLHRFVELVIDEDTALVWSQLDNGQWQYYNRQGKLLTGWQTIDGSKYYFDSKGTLKTGWLDLNGKTYYMNKEGVMMSGKWVLIDGKWFYFYTDGTLAVNTTIEGYPVGADGARK